MRYRMYQCVKNHYTRGYGGTGYPGVNRYPGQANKPANPGGTQNKMDLILKTKIDNALGKYNDDPTVRAEIQNKVAVYLCNRKIAEEYSDKKSLRRLRNELIEYLNQI